jgi:hypothetical protein
MISPGNRRDEGLRIEVFGSHEEGQHTFQFLSIFFAIYLRNLETLVPLGVARGIPVFGSISSTFILYKPTASPQFIIEGAVNDIETVNAHGKLSLFVCVPLHLLKLYNFHAKIKPYCLPFLKSQPFSPLRKCNSDALQGGRSESIRISVNYFWR